MNSGIWTEIVFVHPTGYVACSRARLETRLYVAGDALEPEHHSRRADKGDPTTRLAMAFERSAAEQVALAQRRPDTSDVSRRALERSRRQREQALATTERRLSAAEEKLRGLGRLGHRRMRSELQAEIARQQAAIRLARKQLALCVLSRGSGLCQPGVASSGRRGLEW
jgi:hypothetical protein